MSALDFLTPSGVAVPSAPSVPVSSRVVGIGVTQFRRYNVVLPLPAPPELRLDLQLGSEDAGFWATVPDLDLTAEGADANEALVNLAWAMRDWLSYIREEGPALGENLAEQERYAALLDYPLYSWFSRIQLVR